MGNNQGALNSRQVADAASEAISEDSYDSDGSGSGSGSASGSRSRSKSKNKRAKTDDDFVIGIMMPTYFIKEKLMPVDIEFAKNSWNHIIENTSTNFHDLKANDPSFKFENCEVIVLYYIVLLINKYLYIIMYLHNNTKLRCGFTVFFTEGSLTSTLCRETCLEPAAQV